MHETGLYLYLHVYEHLISYLRYLTSAQGQLQILKQLLLQVTFPANQRVLNTCKVKYHLKSLSIYAFHY